MMQSAKYDIREMAKNRSRLHDIFINLSLSRYVQRVFTMLAYVRGIGPRNTVQKLSLHVALLRSSLGIFVYTQNL